MSFAGAITAALLHMEKMKKLRKKKLEYQIHKTITHGV